MRCRPWHPPSARAFVLASAIVSALASSLLGTASAAEPDQGSVHVQITDERNKHPIALARVFLVGPHSDVGYTAADGVVEFRGYPPGSYRISVYAPGYANARSDFEVVSGTTADVSAALAPQSALTTIGTVVARVRVSASTGRASAGDAQSSSSGGLSAALGRLPSVSSAPSGVALDGLGVGGTRAAIDGTPLAGAGRSAALSGIGLDLFRSVTAQPLGGRGAPGVDLATNDPTLAFAANALVKHDGLGGTGAIAGVTGTAGAIGFVAMHVDGRTAGPLDGSVYRDASGLVYGHLDETTGTGTLVKLRAPLSSNQSLLGEASSIDLKLRPACAVASGGTPCGFGPGNTTVSRFSDAFVRYLYAAPNANVGFTLASSTQSDRADQLHRLVGGIAAPLLSATQTALSSLAFHYDRSLGLRHSISFDASSERQTTASAIPNVAFGSSQRYVYAALAETYSPRIGESLRFSLDLPSSGSRAGANAAFDKADAKGGEAALQVRILEPRQPALPQVPIAGTIFDPPSAAYDCLHQQVFVNGVGAVSGVPADTGGTLGYKRARGDWAFEVQAAHDSIVDGVVPVVSRGATSGPNAATPDLLARIAAFYASRDGCGKPAVLGPAQLIVSAPVSARLVYDRLTFSVALRTRGPLIAPYLQYTSARYDAGSGKQTLPYVPRYRAGFLVDARLKRARSEVLGYLDYVGSNNAAGLPPHMEASVGFSARLPYGSLTAGVTNVGQAWAAKFASSAFAAPLPNGILPIARPLAPRTFHVTYDVGAGRPSTAGQIDALAALASVAQPSNDTFSLTLRPLEPGPPEHVFEPNLTLDSCTPEGAAITRAVLDAMRLEAAREPASPSEPDAAIAVDPQFGVKVVAHRRSGHVSFALFVQNSRADGRISGCVRLQAAGADELRARGAYVPSDAESDAAFVFFDPNVGMYRVTGDLPAPAASPEPGRPTVEQVVLDPPPTAAPAEPFRLRETCPERLRPFAQTVLAQLAADLPAVLAGKNARPSPYTQLILMGGDRPRWVAIRFLDASARTTIDTCAHVAGISHARLSALQIDDRSEDLGFAPDLGLFEPF
ncbi:MAG TPA: carboxypeptidase-like regulatory domain-containing protein [Candidatus Elarobacter sp.]|jgi:hypothetical protein|nr:carboxypeptidase-like regulatory domain-containing protein [Candidatus Elarobacter sp.]